MSIDATITGILINKDGVKLILEQPDKSRCAGQNSLYLEGNIPNVRILQLLIDEPVWGSNDCLMMGETKIGQRIGYGGLELYNLSIQEAYCNKHKKEEVL